MLQYLTAQNQSYVDKAGKGRIVRRLLQQGVCEGRRENKTREIRHERGGVPVFKHALTVWKPTNKAQHDLHRTAHTAPHSSLKAGRQDTASYTRCLPYHYETQIKLYLLKNEKLSSQRSTATRLPSVVRVVTYEEHEALTLSETAQSSLLERVMVPS